MTADPTQGEPIDELLARYREQVDAELDRLLPAADLPPARLHEAMRYAVFGGGKRLRPVCCMLAAGAVGGDPGRALPAACALELIHTYSLVHDDLPCMDDDDVRRGRPTVHVAYDDALAVLVGDGLQTVAFEALALGLDGAALPDATSVLARAAGSRGMVGGQVADLDGEGRDLTRDEVLFIDEHKTAALFKAAFALGGISVGATEEDVARLAAIGHDLGVAFQIVDDLLDRRSTSAELGKAAGKDDARGKATLPAVEGEDAAYEEARRRTAAARRGAAELADGAAVESLIRRMLDRTH